MKTSTITNITNIKKIYAKTVERNKKKVQIKKKGLDTFCKVFKHLDVSFQHDVQKSIFA